MMKRLLAVLSIVYAVFVWYMAVNAGDRANQDWAPIGTVMFGVLGGIVLLLVAVVTSVDSFKAWNLANRDGAGTGLLIPTLCFFNAGWVLCAIAVFKVVVFD